jgi:hypothetical protein
MVGFVNMVQKLCIQIIKNISLDFAVRWLYYVWYSKGPELEPGDRYSEVSRGFVGHSKQLSGY